MQINSRVAWGVLLCATVAACSGSSVVGGGTDGGGTDLGAADGSFDSGLQCDGSGLTTCGDRCVDTSADLANCGACGTRCGAGMACVSGVCAVSCPTGQSVCNGACVSLATDRANCGACGTVCPGGQVCTGGLCATSCATGQTACGAGASATCANLQTDNANCGACGTACPAGQVCSLGACAASCGAGLTDCSGSCVSASTDPLHCGSCTNACMLANVATQACAAGACVVGGCAEGAGDCDGMAANGCEAMIRTSDVNNCGGCGVRCAFANAAATCAAGACGMGACAAGFADCNGSPADGCERNVNSDNASCGGCGVVCSGGQVCSNGACTATCGAGLAACSGSCVATATDPSNCGACGNVCALGNVGTQACVASACAVGACATGFGNCDGMAANGCETSVRAADVNNCGGCGVRCSFANAASTCATGVCALGACAAGFRNCDGNAANGCEVSTNTDSNNCGACGNVCAGGQVCSGGVCTTTCGAGLSNCSGACTNTTFDPGNCGGCGMVCPPRASAASFCAASLCGFRCNAGFADCNAVAGDGCEANLATTSHCGGCGIACVAPNGTPGCSSSACVVAACNPGFANCDGIAANGCETGTAANVNNCGACGTVCSNNNGAPTCSGGSCGIVCSPGFGNCDGNVGNGCETGTLTNPSHCGGCGVVCASGRSCVAGACVIVGGAVTINFDNFSAGTPVTSQYPGVVFSSDPGHQNVVHAFVTGGSSPPNIICTRVTNGALNCAQPTFLAFASPVNNLQFRGVGIDNTPGSVVARADLYAGATLLGSRNVIAAGSSVGVVVDCTAFSGVTRLEIVNIVDGGGIGWDNFSYVQ